MFFIILVLAAALVLETLGSYISVVGLASNASPIIIFLAISLDFSKVMIATVLYKRWKDIHLLLRTFLIPSLLFLMIVTSSGTYAFLLREFSKTTAGQQQLTAKIELLNTEKAKLETRKKEIDTQISQLPPSSVLQRKRMTELFSEELTYINKRVIDLDREIPKSTIAIMEGESHTGTLGSIAKAYGTSVENINRIIAFLIVLVVDPLAIVLLTVANFLMEQRKKDRREILLQKLNGKEPLDEESLLDELKRKVNFLKSKLSKENLSISNIFSDSKSDLIQKPLMNKDKHKLRITNYVLYTSLVDNPKVYVPVRYSSNQTKLNELVFLKESRPVIFKVKPEKKQENITTFEFVSNQSVIPPIKVVMPLTGDSVIINTDSTIISDKPAKPVEIEAQKDFISIPLYKFCIQAINLEPQFIHKQLEGQKESINSGNSLQDITEVNYAISKNIYSLENTNIVDVITEVSHNVEILEKELPEKLFVTKFIKQNSNEVENIASQVKLEVHNIITNIEDNLDNNKQLTAEKQEALVEHEFIVNWKSVDQNEPTIIPIKKTQKPVPKSIIKVDVKKGGFFDEFEDKKFSPSNYEDPIVYEDDYLWDEESERAVDNQDPIIIAKQEKLTESDYLALSGFSTSALLKENFTL